LTASGAQTVPFVHCLKKKDVFGNQGFLSSFVHPHNVLAMLNLNRTYQEELYAQLSSLVFLFESMHLSEAKYICQYLNSLKD